MLHTICRDQNTNAPLLVTSSVYGSQDDMRASLDILAQVCPICFLYMMLGER